MVGLQTVRILVAPASRRRFCNVSRQENRRRDAGATKTARDLPETSYMRYACDHQRHSCNARNDFSLVKDFLGHHE